MPSAINTPTAIIVGAGFAGITAAVECAQRGIQVKVYEAAKSLTALGLLLHFQPPLDHDEYYVPYR